MCWYVVFPSLFRSLVLDGNTQRDEIYNEINKLKRKKKNLLFYLNDSTTEKKASGLSRPIRNNDDDSQQ